MSVFPYCTSSGLNIHRYSDNVFAQSSKHSISIFSPSILCWPSEKVSDEAVQNRGESYFSFKIISVMNIKIPFVRDYNVNRSWKIIWGKWQKISILFFSPPFITSVGQRGRQLCRLIDVRRIAIQCPTSPQFPWKFDL